MDIAIWWLICHTAFPICGTRQSLVMETKFCFSNLTTSHRQHYTTSPQRATKDSEPRSEAAKVALLQLPKAPPGGGLSLEQQFSTFVMLCYFNMAPHAVVTSHPTARLSSLILHNGNFHIVRNHNLNIYGF